MIAEIFNALSAAVAGFVNIMVELFDDTTGIVAVFYNGTNLTLAGTLLLLAFGYGLVRYGFAWIKGLVSLRGAR